MNLLEKTNRTGKNQRHLFAVAASVLLAGACLGISAYSLQVGHSPIQDFEGTWKAIHDSKAFILLQLHAENGRASGSIQRAGFQMDLQGTGALVT